MCKYLKHVQEINNKHNNKITQFSEQLLNNLNLNNFWYYQLNNNGNISCISTQAEWAETFAGERYHLIYPHLCHPKFHKQGIILHKAIEDDSLQTIYEKSKKFGIFQSLVYINRTCDGIEEFGFSSGCTSDNQTSLMVNEWPLLRLFIRKFKEENRPILLKLNENPVNLASMIGDKFFDNRMMHAKNKDKEKLLIKLGIDFTLSPREIELLQKMLLGFSAGRIGLMMFLSKRTIEHHIERIKLKLNCDSKSSLIQTARELEHLGFLNSGSVCAPI